MAKIGNKEITHLNLLTKIKFVDGSNVIEGVIKSFDKHYIYMRYYDEDAGEWKTLKDNGERLEWNDFIYLSDEAPVDSNDFPNPPPPISNWIDSLSHKVAIGKKVKYKVK